MAEQTWDLDPDRLRISASNIAQVEAQIRAVPPDQRSYYQLQQRGITIPPGYRLERDGQLKYVAVNNVQHWYNKPEVMIPLIASAGLTYGATSGFGLVNGGAQGAAIPTIPSTTYRALNLTTPSLTTAATTPMTTNTILDTLRRGRDIYDRVRPYVDALGRVAGGAADQRAEDRGAQTEFDLYNNQAYNTAQQSRTGQQNTQALQYANARTQAETDRMRQLGSVDMLSSMKAPTDPRARFDNGGRMSPEHLAMVRERAMKALESGSDVPKLTDMPAYRETQMAQPTGTDSVLNALRLGRQAADIFSPQQTTPVVNPTNDGGRTASVNAPSDVEASIFDRQETPWWMRQAPATMRGN